MSSEPGGWKTGADDSSRIQDLQRGSESYTSFILCISFNKSSGLLSILALNKYFQVTVMFIDHVDKTHTQQNKKRPAVSYFIPDRGNLELQKLILEKYGVKVLSRHSIGSNSGVL